MLALAAFATLTSVSTTDLTLQDSVRDKELPIRVDLPAGSEPTPTLVFSHGAGGSGRNYGPLVETWVEAGYAVIRPTHEDSRSLGGQGVGSLGAWRSRPADIRLILDRLDEIEAQVDWAGSFDRSKIAVAGHSFGAHTAQLLGGTLVRTESFRDERVVAALLISPQGEGGEIGSDAWREFAVPQMTVTGSRDFGRNRQEAEWRLHPFERSPAGDRWLVWIEGADHGFGGITGLARGSEDASHLRAVREATTAFLDLYVKGDLEARTRLLALTDDTVQISER